jgi:hypothetical protein
MQVKDRTVRRLTALEQSASTARVLNLLAPHRKADSDPALVQAPFFRNRLLNQSILLKHRVRPHEMELFSTPRATVTKILIPIDGADLKVGARARSSARRISTRRRMNCSGTPSRPASRTGRCST